MDRKKLQDESEDSVTRSYTRRTLPAQPGRCCNNPDAVGLAGTQSGQLGHHPAGQDTVGITRTLLCWPRCHRYCRDAVGSAGTQLGQPGRIPAGRDTVEQSGPRCDGQDTAGTSAGTPSGWSGRSRVSQVAVGSAGSPSGWPGHRVHSQGAVVLVKMSSGQPGRRPAGRDTAGLTRMLSG